MNQYLFIYLLRSGEIFFYLHIVILSCEPKVANQIAELFRYQSDPIKRPEDAPGKQVQSMEVPSAHMSDTTAHPQGPRGATPYRWSCSVILQGELTLYWV